MKKLMFLLPLAVAAMVSCSNSDEVFESAPQLRNTELKLFPQIQGNTRGVVETTSSLSAFDVIIKGSFATTATGGASDVSALVSATKGGSGWSLGTNYFWGDESTSASFTAYANAYTAAVDADATQLISQVVPAALASQKDLLVAFNSGAKTAFASGVPLHFRHAMSQVVVNASYATDGTYSEQFPALNIKVKSVKFVNLANTGTLTLPTASTASGETYTAAWSAVSGTEEYVCSPSSPVTLGASASYIDQSEANNPLLLMPQTTAATTDLAKADVTSTTGAYMMLLVDINYVESRIVGAETYKRFDLYPMPQTPLTADQTTDGIEDNYAWIAVPVNIDWKAGYKYTYTLNFSNIACGKAAPGATEGAEGVNAGDPIISGVKQPLTFLVTVESEWQDGGSTSPAL